MVLGDGEDWKRGRYRQPEDGKRETTKRLTENLQERFHLWSQFLYDCVFAFLGQICTFGINTKMIIHGYDTFSFSFQRGRDHMSKIKKKEEKYAVSNTKRSQIWMESEAKNKETEGLDPNAASTSVSVVFHSFSARILFPLFLFLFVFLQ